MDNAHGLVIGIANYNNVRPLPPSVLKDAKGIYDILIDEQYCAYPIENVQLMLNEQATDKGIQVALSRLAEKTNTESTVFIYLSSHGAYVPDGEYAGQYIVPVNAHVDSYAALARTAISGDEFTEALANIQAGKVLVLFDCCHSGGIGAVSGGPEGGLQSKLTEDLYDRLKQGKGRAIIASSRGSEESYILPGAENSIFTTHIMAGLKGGIASDDGFVRLFDLFEYLQPRVVGDEPHQHPVFKAEIEENFPVSLYRGGQIDSADMNDQGFRYDVYINFADADPVDEEFVYDTLIPHLEEGNLKVAVSEDVQAIGVARVVNVERGVTQSKRTLLVFSDSYFEDNIAQFLDTLALTIGIEKAQWRVVPLKYRDMKEENIPARLRMLTPVDLTDPRRAERIWKNLAGQLAQPLPTGFV